MLNEAVADSAGTITRERFVEKLTYKLELAADASTLQVYVTSQYFTSGEAQQAMPIHYLNV